MRKPKASTTFAALLVVCIVGGSACSEKEPSAEGEVRSELQAVLEPLARRELTPAEIDTVTDEYLQLFDENGCGETCRENVRLNAERIKPVREAPGTPADFRVRHDYATLLYFSQQQRGSLIQRLSVEADPILVLDPSGQQLMTRTDVMAAINLKSFAESGEALTTKTYADEEVEPAVDALSVVYKTDSNVLPVRLYYASAFWAGVEQNWDHWTDLERDQVRSYFSNQDTAQPLSGALYSELLDLTPQQGEQLAIDEILRQFKADSAEIAVASALHTLEVQRIQSYFNLYPY